MEKALNTVINTLIALIALIHVYILVLEMFLWTTPKGLKVFNQTLEKAQASAVLAANQGLYNGFLAAGLIWSLRDPAVAIRIFFLSCIFIAGLYGSFSANKKILFIQTIPAAITLALIYIHKGF